MKDTDRHRHRQRERERERDRQTDRQTENDADSYKPSCHWKPRHCGYKRKLVDPIVGYFVINPETLPGSPTTVGIGL